MKKALILLVLAVCFTASTAFSASREITRTYDGIRPLGMGNAYTANATGEDALFYNPAGLNRIEEWGMMGTLFSGGFNSNAIDFAKVAFSLADDQQQRFDDILRFTGKNIHIRLDAIKFSYTRKNFGIMLLPVSARLNTSIRGLTIPQLDMNVVSDSLLIGGYSHGFFKHTFENNKKEIDTLAVGVSAKAGYRLTLQEDISATQLAPGGSVFGLDSAKEGMFFDMNLGFLYTLPYDKIDFLKWMKYARPTFGFSINNLLNYGYITNLHLIDENSENPANLGRAFNLGVLFEFPKLWTLRPRLTFDLRDMGRPYTDTFWKTTHLGVEILWELGIISGAYRFGLNQGYVCAGLTARLWKFSLDIATYGEELGAGTGQLGDRRFMVQLATEI